MQAIDTGRILSDMTLSERRMKHTLGVVEAAKLLAKTHFPELDSSLVEAAALMHDFTKEYSLDAQFELCDKYGIALSEDEKREPKLLHAKTAAAIAKTVYSFPKPAYDAIYWHTTGRAAMTGFEIVIYLADYIEEFRDDKGCIRVREYYRRRMLTDGAETALMKTLVFSFDTTIKHLINGDKTINSETVTARNYYLNSLTERKFE